MNEKKLKLIEIGMKLFATRGYHATSIQEIVSNAGVSKGAFYLNFESKEDFVATALQFYHGQIQNEISSVRKQTMPARESLARQIETFTNYIYKYKEFIMVFLRENISIGENTDKLFQEMKCRNFLLLRQNITNIYGETAEPYLVDCIVQLEALINGYFKWIVMDDIRIEPAELGAYIVRRMDDMIHGMLKRNETTLITLKNIPIEYTNFLRDQTAGEQLKKVLQEIYTTIRTLDLSKEKEGELLEAVDVITRESTKNHQHTVMIQGMLAHFQRIPELTTKCQQVADLLHIRLLK